jgi:hypothetical protein
MLRVSLPEATESNIRQLAALSGLKPEDVAKVLVAASLMPTTTPAEAVTASPYRTRPDLTREEYHALIDSLGSHAPSGVTLPVGVDLRELAYADD